MRVGKAALTNSVGRPQAPRRDTYHPFRPVARAPAPTGGGKWCTPRRMDACRCLPAQGGSPHGCLSLSGQLKSWKRSGGRVSSQPTGVQPLQLADVRAIAQRIAGNVERVLVGKPDAVRTALITLLAEGHLLIEDVPGVGKTSLAKALARSVDCTVSRIQFTP